MADVDHPRSGCAAPHRATRGPFTAQGGNTSGPAKPAPRCLLDGAVYFNRCELEPQK